MHAPRAQLTVAGLIESSGKMVLLLEVIQQCCYIDERVLVFSQSLSTLSYIEKVCCHSSRHCMLIGGRC